MKKEQKEQVVEELTARLKAAETLLVADYRGLTMTQIDALRTRLLESGARFTVVKNTLTRRAAEAAGTEALLALLDGPSAIAFLETDGDMLAAAIMQGRAVTAAEVETLAKLPPVDVLRGQVLGAIVAPLTTFVGLLNAPLQNLVGLVDARIEQLGGEEEAPAEEEAPVEEAPEPEAEAAPAEEAPAEEEPAVEESSAEETTQADATAPAAETPEEES